MTRNAAMLLGELLTSYTVIQNESPEAVRNFSGISDLKRWREHAEAIDLVRRVDEHVQALEADGQAVIIFKKSLPYWYAGVAFASTPWASQTARARAVCDESHMDLLSALGMLIDNRPHVEISSEDERSLQDVLGEAQLLLEQDEGLPAEARWHIQLLLERAIFYLEHLEKYGPEAVRDVALQLGGAMYTRAEGQEDPEKKKRMHAVAWMLVGGFLNTASSEGAKALGHAAGAGIKAIGN